MVRNILAARKLPVLFTLFIILCIVYYLQSPVTINEYSAKWTDMKSPPVVLNPMGGLGNQLFQYACAYTLAKERNSDLYICVYKQWKLSLQSLLWDPHSLNKRLYSLDQFKIPQDKVITSYVRVIDTSPDCGAAFAYTLDNRIIENAKIDESDVMNGNLPRNKVLVVQSYFESEIFFKKYKDDIINLYSANANISLTPIKHLLEMVTVTESVAVHIRRGDFLVKTDFRGISISYQKEAMQKMHRVLNTTNLHFYIFTDDLDYAKSQLLSTEFKNLYFVPELNKSDNPLLDFLLMLSCKHNIIANSTFSWWAAYLNKNKKKIVIAPMPKYTDQWINKTYGQNSDLRKLISQFAYPEGWIMIKPEFDSYPEQKSRK